MRKTGILLIAATLLVSLVGGISHGQEMEEMEEVTRYSYGTVISVTANQIVLSEYDVDTEESMRVTYTINAQTRFQNFESVDELEEYDDVEVEYIEEGGRKIALIITKEQAYLPEDEEVLPDTDAEFQPLIEGFPDETRG